MTNFHPQYNNEAKKLAEELERKGISDKSVLTAIATIPRDSFIDKQLSAYAYLDRPCRSKVDKPFLNHSQLPGRLSCCN